MRLKTRRINNTIVVTLPKTFCTEHNVCGEEHEYVDVLIHQVIKYKDDTGEEVKELKKLLELK